MERDTHASIPSAFPEGILLATSTVELCVFSNDARLIATCQEVLRELDAPDLSASHAPLPRVQLWDYAPGERPPPFAQWRTRFFVTPAAHLDRLQADFPEAQGNILLKPVSRVVLRAFLASIARGRGGQRLDSEISEEIGTLRANRDEIFQHLLHANLRLQEYDQQRTNFIARALHDFRAPLTALSGFCGLLNGGELGPLSAAQQEAVGRMQRSTQRLSRMSAAMFELSAGPRRVRAPDLREGDILEPVRQALHEIEPLAREKQIEVRTELSLPSAPLHFEGSQLEQVVVNLLDNACKFVPKFGWIEVRGYCFFWERRVLATRGLPGQPDQRKERSEIPNSYRIDIRDSGPGVPPDRLEHIFEEYTSYSGPQDRSGGGLGLAICRLILSRHHGHVWAEASGDGSTFSLVLPFRTKEAERKAEEAER